MTITIDNYKTLKDQVEGKRLDQLSLADTYPALCYLTHRRLEEDESGKQWTANQIRIVRDRQRSLLAAKGIFVLTAK